MAHGVDDPWGYGNSLEWAASCPPPRHNFTELPRIRSEQPAFELHYPHMVARIRDEAHLGTVGTCPCRTSSRCRPCSEAKPLVASRAVPPRRVQQRPHHFPHDHSTP